ncbi:MAG TPA: hypothetical protein VFD58_35415 [Blastocatellia bacterium]|nr:hypothetical protein [Blastocatellia bacterium]
MSLSKLYPARRIPNALKRRVLAGAFAVFISLLLVSSGSSHDPITTNITFNKEIIRIFERSCLACHGQSSLTDITLASYEQARPWAKAIKEEVLEKRMPPFQAVKGFGSFHNAYLLPQRDIELIVSWVEGGAPKGEEKDLPRDLAAANTWPLGQPDLILQPAAETAIPAGQGYEDRRFTLPTNLAADAWASAVDFQPGNRSIVHSATFAIERSGKGRGGGLVSEKLGEWVPGQSAASLPEGVGRLLPAGARIVLKIRYRKTSEAASDLSAVGIYFAKGEAIRQANEVKIAPVATTIPAGVEKRRVKASWLVKEATEALAVRPLLYPLGKSVEVTAYRPDGTAEVLIFVKNYRHDWQPGYYFKSPVPLPAGTRLEVTAYLDNSDDNPNVEKPKVRKFAEPLCQLLLARAPVTQPAVVSSSADSSAGHKH